MDPESLEPKTKKAEARNLEEMSIEALKVYISELEAEIERARAMIQLKEKARRGADGLFKR